MGISFNAVLHAKALATSTEYSKAEHAFLVKISDFSQPLGPLGIFLHGLITPSYALGQCSDTLVLPA